jgi:hypothetical protein
MGTPSYGFFLFPRSVLPLLFYLALILFLLLFFFNLFLLVSLHSIFLL